MPDEIDWSAWQTDGHRITLKAGLWTPPRSLDPPTSYGQVTLDVRCPEDSVCKRHFGPTTPACIVAGEVSAVGFQDFFDTELDTEGLPADWSSSVKNMEIEWLDKGEDGLIWRPRFPFAPDPHRELLGLILDEMAAATNRELAADGDAGDDEIAVWRKIEQKAREIRGGA